MRIRHRVVFHRPDRSEHSHSLAFTLRSLRGRFLLHGTLNAYWEPLTFELAPVPAASPRPWRRCVDTAAASPDDFWPWETAPFVDQVAYVTQPRSTVLLVLPLQVGADGVSAAQ